MSQGLRHDLAKRDPALLNPQNDPDRMVQASGVAARYDISVRTLDRWLQKPHLDFPQPVMRMHDIAGRVSARFWRVGDLIEWERAQAARAASASTFRHD